FATLSETLHRGANPFPTRRSADLGAATAWTGIRAAAHSGRCTAPDTSQDEPIAVDIASTARVSSRPRNNTVATSSARGSTLMVIDRKSTRLNSSHVKISYAVFCLK